MNELLRLDSLPKISAIYYALLSNGYGEFAVKDDPELVEALKAFRSLSRLGQNRFFEQVRQSGCAAYPYWPRAALLESASFSIDPRRETYTDFARFRGSVLAASNITDADRDERFWNWIREFPRALASVFADEGFRKFRDWENGWLSRQSIRCEKELAVCARIRGGQTCRYKVSA